MFGWLKRKLNGTRELEHFVASLRAISASDLGALVALATVIRLNMRTAGHLPDAVTCLATFVPLDLWDDGSA